MQLAQNIGPFEANGSDSGVEPVTKVSVVIPTFNRSELLVNAVESALQQTYQNREIIVVDDGSTDDTAERLAPYMDRIRYFYQENRGASAAQNKGIEVARGEWVSILASDDLWLPAKLECQIRALAELNEQFGACFTDCSYFGNPAISRTAFERAGLECSSEFKALENPQEHVLAKHPILFVQSMLVLRSLLEKLHRFDERLVVGEDTDLLFRLSFHTRFCIVRAPLVQIDRTPLRPRLIDLANRKNDLAFASIAERYDKWLGLQELTDPGIHRKIHEDRLSLYYDWAIAKFYQFKFAEAFSKLEKIRKTGASSLTVAGRLLFRAARKVLSPRAAAKSKGFETADSSSGQILKSTVLPSATKLS